jgi:hypothetical protein
LLERRFICGASACGVAEAASLRCDWRPVAPPERARDVARNDFPRVAEDVAFDDEALADEDFERDDDERFAASAFALDVACDDVEALARDDDVARPEGVAFAAPSAASSAAFCARPAPRALPSRLLDRRAGRERGRFEKTSSESSAMG